jgi:outer membrane protein insertion porin family
MRAPSHDTETTPFPFLDMDSPLLDQHARINAVRVDGAKNTRRSFLASIVNPHLPQHPHSSFESVLRATRDIGHYLVQSDIFQVVHARLEPSADTTTKPGDVDVIFTTRERPRFFLKTSTEVGNSEGNAVRIHTIPRVPYLSQKSSLLPRARQAE